MRRRLQALALAVVLALAGCSAATAPQTEAAPVLEGHDLTGQAHRLSDLRGEVVIVTVWASWCAPCREEFPVLERALDALEPEGLRVLGINFRDVPAAAEEFLAQQEASFPSVVDLDGSVSIEWGVRAVPQAFLVDRDGTILERRFGAIDDAWIEGVVTAAVRG
ncbi:TlpA family protein disulfide reductase [Microbacterium album]|uniref:Thioredoxin n=1 Tax=Microbacterium album TaxID=2053191 RepID=A0A917MME5_9MICO|nr:TlpA disulfide reductase family protein [Microbacterium album]GGH48009.1 thioredoxin [Microbacterium album]